MAEAELARRPFGVSIKGENREVTVMVCRIANCSDLCGDLRAREVIQLLNYFCGEAAKFLLGRGGYLDEWEPDGVRFYFGLPLEDESHAETACRVAFDLKVHLEKVREECGERWQVPVEGDLRRAQYPITHYIGHNGPPWSKYNALLAQHDDLCCRISGFPQHHLGVFTRQGRRCRLRRWSPFEPQRRADMAHLTQLWMLDLN